MRFSVNYVRRFEYPCGKKILYKVSFQVDLKLKDKIINLIKYKQMYRRVTKLQVFPYAVHQIKNDHFGTFALLFPFFR